MGLLFPSPGDLLDPGIEPACPASLALAGRFFTTEPPGKPLVWGRWLHYYYFLWKTTGMQKKREFILSEGKSEDFTKRIQSKLALEEWIITIMTQIYWGPNWIMGFPGGSAGKESACNAGDLGLIPGWEDPLEKWKTTHFSILAKRIHNPLGRRVRHNWVILAFRRGKV